jgi:D-alanyl-D-alanine carboxypeptidase
MAEWYGSYVTVMLHAPGEGAPGPVRAFRGTIPATGCAKRSMAKIPDRWLTIHTAAAADRERLTAWLKRHPALASSNSGSGRGAPFAQCLADRCVLVAARGDHIRGIGALDIDRGAIGTLALASERSDSDLLRPLVAALERLAVRYDFDALALQAPAMQAVRFARLGYRAAPAVSPRTGADPWFQRSLRRRFTRYARRVRRICADLGLPADYARRHRLPIQHEAVRLVSIGADVFGREQQLTPTAARAWRAMMAAASKDAVVLQVVSAFRSAEYQRELLQRKLARGQHIAQILRVSAAPGFSQHHTGNALDLTAPGAAMLEEEFERTAAFGWLTENASRFGFELTFPRANRHGLAYEPWHWCYRGRYQKR